MIVPVDGTGSAAKSPVFPGVTVNVGGVKAIIVDDTVKEPLILTRPVMGAPNAELASNAAAPRIPAI
jgi:hypothetical protein